MNDFLQTCRDEIAATGAPSYRARLRFMSSHGPYTPALDARGHLARAYISIACAERTLHFWRDRHGDDVVVRGLLACRPFLEGAFEAAAFQRLYLAAYAAVHDFPYELIGIDDSVLCSGFGAVTAMSVCRSDDEPLDGATENDVDPWDWDSAFNSAVAVAGGADWQADKTKLDLAARADFWRWWADDAILEATRLADRTLQR